MRGHMSDEPWRLCSKFHNATQHKAALFSVGARLWWKGCRRTPETLWTGRSVRISSLLCFTVYHLTPIATLTSDFERCFYQSECWTVICTAGLNSYFLTDLIDIKTPEIKCCFSSFTEGFFSSSYIVTWHLNPLKYWQIWIKCSQLNQWFSFPIVTLWHCSLEVSVPTLQVPFGVTNWHTRCVTPWSHGNDGRLDFSSKRWVTGWKDHGLNDFMHKDNWVSHKNFLGR